MSNTNLTGRSKSGLSAAATENSWSMPAPVKQLAIKNTHASQTLSVRAFSGTNAAGALALAAATPATIGGDDTFLIAAGERKVIFKSPRARNVTVSAIGSGAATTFNVEGTDFFD